MGSVCGEVEQYFEASGRASALFQVRVGPDLFALKVPVEGGDRNRSMSAREWTFGRFAERAGLPVLALHAIEVDPMELRAKYPRGDLDLGDRTTFTATPLITPRERLTWGELPLCERVRLFLWDCAVCVGCGDKIRDPGPRDFYRCALGERLFIMLDYEALPDVWDAVLVERVQPPPHDRPIEALFADASNAPKDVVPEVLSCFDDDTWRYIVADLELFWPQPDRLDALRSELRSRVEHATQFLPWR